MDNGSFSFLKYLDEKASNNNKNNDYELRSNKIKPIFR